MKRINADGIEYEVSSGNVFADLGIPDAEKLKIKTGLIVEIMNAMERKGLTQIQAAKIMGLTQPKISEMMNGKLNLFSERKLMECLNSLGYDIEIKVKPTEHGIGQIQLACA